jgi:hypothetical protein
MDKAGELEAHWRGHVDAWRASGDSQKAYCEQHGLRSHSLSYWHLRLAKGPVSSAGGKPLTLVPAVRVPSAAAAAPSLSLYSPQGWRLEFATLPPAGWVTALWGERS